MRINVMLLTSMAAFLISISGWLRRRSRPAWRREAARAGRELLLGGQPDQRRPDDGGGAVNMPPRTLLIAPGLEVLARLVAARGGTSVTIAGDPLPLGAMDMTNYRPLLLTWTDGPLAADVGHLLDGMAQPIHDWEIRDLGDAIDQEIARVKEHGSMRPMSREQIWDVFVDALNRAGQAGSTAEVLTPTDLHPEAPGGRRFGALTGADIDTLVRIASTIGRRGDIVKQMWHRTQR